MEKSDSPKSIRVFCAFPTVTLLLAKTEVALNRERRLLDLGLLLDLRLVLDLRFALNTLRTLRLALDPLRTRRSRACLFARRAVAFNPPVGAGVAVRAVLFQLTVRAGGALRAAVFPLPMWAPLLSSHLSPPRALASTLRAPRRAKTGVVAFVKGTFREK